MATIKTQGITITVADSGGTPVTIGGHLSISGIDSGQATKIDITTQASTAFEHRLGLVDNGDFTIELNADLDDAGQQELNSIRTTGATREMVITFPEGTINTLTFDCTCPGLSLDGGINDVVKSTATISITGGVTRSAV